MTRASSVRCRFSPRFEALEDRTLLATCTVTNLSDLNLGRVGMSIVSGDTAGNLRFCINRANAMPGPDVIDFNVTGTISLKGALPVLASDIDIQGPGSDSLTIRRDTGGFYRIFDVAVGATVGISGVTMSNGYQKDGSHSELNGGGGIRNQGTLLVADSVIENCVHYVTTIAKGGGIFNRGDLTLIRTTIRNNQLEFGDYLWGAGIYSHNGSAPASVSIYDSTIMNNGADDGIGASDATGGGVYSHDDAFLLIVNSTIHGNWADIWGGVYAFGLTIISHSTITDNISGGVCPAAIGDVFMRNTVVAGNTGADVAGTLTASDYNLIGNSQFGSGFGPTDILNVDPMLGPLQDNGGPTFTRALLPGSPAIDAGDNSDAPEFDQRGPGFPRIVNGTIDIGAFEVQSTPVPGVNLAVLLTAKQDLD